MNLNELIKKYEDKAKECDRIKASAMEIKDRAIQNEFRHFYLIYRVYVGSSLLDTEERNTIEKNGKEFKVIEDILSDLEQLKESLKNGEGMERLADVEHKRWAKWQKYLHSLCTKNEDGSLTIPKERVEWWNKEIETSYYHLEEKLKEYDRIEVRNTLKEIIGE